MDIYLNDKVETALVFFLDDWFDSPLQFEVDTRTMRHSAETTILP